MPSRRVDVAVVGAGPAGLAAGIHLARARIPHLVFERAEPGGLLNAAGLVECYPGFPGGIAAPALVCAMVEQAEQLGVAIVRAEVERLGWSGGRFDLCSAGDRYEAGAVVLATGTVPRPLPSALFASDIPWERIHHGTATLPASVRGARVWVSGGGDAAFDSALQLAQRGASVELGMRGDRPRAMALLVDRVREAGVAVHPRCPLLRVSREGDGLALTTADGSQVRRVDALLVCHGRDPEHSLWHGLAGSQARGPREVESHYPGLFMAGDLVRGDCRYAAVAAGDGLRCARLAEAHLERYRGAPP